LTPADYAPLLRAIASAGYVVAAPIFPLTNTHALGGPNEADLVNQPRDVSFVITKLLALNGSKRPVGRGCRSLAHCGRGSVRRRDHRTRGRVRRAVSRPASARRDHHVGGATRWFRLVPTRRTAPAGDAGHRRHAQCTGDHGGVLRVGVPAQVPGLARRCVAPAAVHRRAAAARNRRAIGDRISRPLPPGPPACGTLARGPTARSDPARGRSLRRSHEYVISTVQPSRRWIPRRFWATRPSPPRPRRRAPRDAPRASRRPCVDDGGAGDSLCWSSFSSCSHPRCTRTSRRC